MVTVLAKSKKKKNTTSHSILIHSFYDMVGDWRN